MVTLIFQFSIIMIHRGAACVQRLDSFSFSTECMSKNDERNILSSKACQPTKMPELDQNLWHVRLRRQVSVSHEALITSYF